jgi:MFS family permease
MSESRVSTSQIVSYSLPAFGTAMVLLSVAVYLPNYYTDELGLSAGLLSWVLMAGRLWDAVTDPVMGHISDRTRSRWGRRRPTSGAAVPLDRSLHVVSAGLASGPLHAPVVCYLVLSRSGRSSDPAHLLGMELTTTITSARACSLRRLLPARDGGGCWRLRFAKAAGGRRLAIRDGVRVRRACCC